MKSNTLTPKKQNYILEGSLWKGLILFALPIALSSLLQQMFNAADQAVVGRFAGGTALAAVGANTPVVNLLVNVFSACSIGTNVLIARKIGEANEHAISRIVHTSITFALCSGLGLMLLGQVVAAPLLSLIGTPAEVLPTAVLYLRIYALCFPFALFFNFASAILRSTGDTRRPMIALILAGIINVILNLVLVIGFHLGVAGVAIATAISNVISALATLYFLLKEAGYLKLSFSELSIHIPSLTQMLQIGGPAAIQSAVFSVANVCIQSGINSLGADAIAGSAIIGNFEFVGFFIVNSFCQAATTFCGQNYGANQIKRCRSVIRVSLTEALLCAAAFDLTVVLFRNSLVSIFTTEPGVIAAAVTKIFVVMALHYMIALYEIIAASLRSLGKSMAPALLTIVGSVAFRVCWLLTIFRAFHTLPVLFAVYPASWVATSILMWGYYFYVRGEIFNH